MLPRPLVEGIFIGLIQNKIFNYSFKYFVGQNWNFLSTLAKSGTTLNPLPLQLGRCIWQAEPEGKGGGRIQTSGDQ